MAYLSKRIGELSADKINLIKIIHFKVSELKTEKVQGRFCL